MRLPGRPLVKHGRVKRRARSGMPGHEEGSRVLASACRVQACRAQSGNGKSGLGEPRHGRFRRVQLGHGWSRQLKVSQGTRSPARRSPARGAEIHWTRLSLCSRRVGATPTATVYHVGQCFGGAWLVVLRLAMERLVEAGWSVVWCVEAGHRPG